jgi:Na+-translocating ferredoxin:NAD+ oxidoreductase RNF subunit RnfB
MFSVILTSALSVGLLGLFFGLLLAFASKVFYVKIDERVEIINELLPGANCGGCGFPGCLSYADAIVKKDCAINLCNPAGNEVVKKIADLMGKTAVESERMLAMILCNSGGIDNTIQKYKYTGIQNCKAATLLSYGPNSCVYGCVGQNDCVFVCNFNAFTIDNNGMRRVDRNKCTGCAACKIACPRDLIQIVPISKKVHVLCSSLDKGNIAKANCGAGTACIGCKICERHCDVNAIKVENNIAKIDYSICNNCGICIGKCPTKAIIADP